VRRLVEGTQPAGYRRASWNGRDESGRPVAPGVYYCRLKTDDFFATQKLVVRR
jgi:flagellar hook assembly protein FlgD